MTMPDSSIAAQLGQLLDRQGTMASDVAVIKNEMGKLADHEQHIRVLESLRAKLGAIWTGAVLVGAAMGWLASFLSGRR